MTQSPTPIVRVTETLYRKLDHKKRHPEKYYVTYTSYYSNQIRCNLKQRELTVLYTIVSLWIIGNRDISTSLEELRDKLLLANRTFAKNKITECINQLRKSGILKKIKSRHNLLVLRINPYVFWCGSAEDLNAAREIEKDQWVTEPAEPQQALMSSLIE